MDVPDPIELRPQLDVENRKLQRELVASYEQRQKATSPRPYVDPPLPVDVVAALEVPADAAGPLLAGEPDRDGSADPLPLRPPAR